jgi:rubrerythrin
MGWLARLLGTGATRDLLADLAEDYRAEAEQALRLREHAERARYPQGAHALRRLAEMEDRHAAWLHDHLVSLGGQVPGIEPKPLSGSNQWQRAVAALQGAQAKRRRLIEQIAHWDPDEPEVVELLRRIEQEDSREQEVYEGLIMRSDPQAFD